MEHEHKNIVPPQQFLRKLSFGLDIDTQSSPSLPASQNEDSLPKVVTRTISRYLENSTDSVRLLLSGGLDSSFLGSILLKLIGPSFETVTFSFCESTPTTADAEAAAYLSKYWGVKNHHIVVTRNEVRELFQRHNHSLVNDHINYVQMKCYASLLDIEPAQLIFTGIGVDEILGSSPWAEKFYFVHRQSKLWKFDKFCGLIGKAISFSKLSKLANSAHFALSLRSPFFPTSLQLLNDLTDSSRLLNEWELLWETFHPENDLERFQHFLIAYDLGEIQLPAAENFKKHSSTKVIHPYLDPEIMRFWGQIPIPQRWYHGSKKTHLRECASASLPQTILKRKKMGLIWPWPKLIRSELREQLRAAIFDSPLLFRTYGFRKRELEEAWTRFIQGKRCPIDTFGWLRLGQCSKVEKSIA